MEQTYYFIIIGALIVEYLLSTISSVLNMNSITSTIPDGFQEFYDDKKYSKSQEYLKDKTKLGLYSSTFSLILTLIVIHFGLFGFLDEFVRSNSTHYIISGLLFFGILFLINDILNIPFSLYSTFVVEEKYGFNKTSIHTYMADKCKGYGLTIVFGSAIMVPVFYFFYTEFVIIFIFFQSSHEAFGVFKTILFRLHGHNFCHAFFPLLWSSLGISFHSLWITHHCNPTFEVLYSTAY